MGASSSTWLVNRRTDLGMVLGPLGLATALLLLIESTGVETPLWAYLLAFVAVDVAHVWATAYLTFLDRERYLARRSLYVAITLGSALGALALHVISPAVFWSAIAYFAIFHFAKQQWGFIRLYAGKAGEREGFDRRLEAVTLATGVLGPVAIWHAAPLGHFDWFDNGERFLVRPPAWVASWVWAVMALVVVVYVARQIERSMAGRAVCWPKQVWMGASWISWTVGLRFTDDLLLSAAFLNFMHGLPFLVLVHRRMQHRWHEAKAPRISWTDKLSAAVSARGRWLWFYALVLVPALVEETLWDTLVWQTYLTPLLPATWDLTDQALAGFARSLAIALLITPQLAHYVLDGVIWKRNAHNDDLVAMLRSS